MSGFIIQLQYIVLGNKYSYLFYDDNGMLRGLNIEIYGDCKL